MSKEQKRIWAFKANASEDGTTGDMFIYSTISSYESWWDEARVTPKNFKKELDVLGDVSNINVYINSDGGEVFSGQAIHSMLKRHKAKVTVYVDGLAASIASVIAMAGDVVKMPRNAMMMIHDPWTIGIGNSKDFRKLADDLDAIGESLIAAYEDKTGQTREKIIELMNAETWLTAEEAVELGFADEIEQSKDIAASLNSGVLTINGQQMDLSRFKNVPKLGFLPAEQGEPPKHNHEPVVSNKTESNEPERPPKVPLSLLQKKLNLQGRVLDR